MTLVLKSIGLLCGLAMASAAAQAQELAPASAPPIEAPAATAPIATPDELAALSGGTDTHTAIALTEQDLTAINTGNRINAGVVGSGSITLQDNALSGFSGIGNVMMNTGHNNNLQSSMSVTIIVTN